MNLRRHLYFRNILLLLLLLLAGSNSYTQPLSRIPPDGRYAENYEGGKRKVSGYYSEGLKHKRWFYYDENGRVTMKEQWDHGVLQWTAIYEKGRLARTIDKTGKISEKPACGCK